MPPLFQLPLGWAQNLKKIYSLQDRSEAGNPTSIRDSNLSSYDTHVHAGRLPMDDPLAQATHEVGSRGETVYRELEIGDEITCSLVTASF